MQLAKETKAIYKVDKVVLIHAEKLEKYLETFLLDEEEHDYGKNYGNCKSERWSW